MNSAVQELVTSERATVYATFEHSGSCLTVRREVEAADACNPSFFVCAIGAGGTGVVSVIVHPILLMMMKVQPLYCIIIIHNIRCEKNRNCTCTTIKLMGIHSTRAGCSVDLLFESVFVSHAVWVSSCGC